MFQDLPEVQDLDVTIDENVQLVVLGVVFSIVESLGRFVVLCNSNVSRKPP